MKRARSSRHYTPTSMQSFFCATYFLSYLISSISPMPCLSTLLSVGYAGKSPYATSGPSLNPEGQGGILDDPPQPCGSIKPQFIEVQIKCANLPSFADSPKIQFPPQTRVPLASSDHHTQPAQSLRHPQSNRHEPIFFLQQLALIISLLQTCPNCILTLLDSLHEALECQSLTSFT